MNYFCGQPGYHCHCEFEPFAIKSQIQNCVMVVKEEIKPNTQIWIKLYVYTI
jgi:hypothetical protein